MFPHNLIYYLLPKEILLISCSMLNPVYFFFLENGAFLNLLLISTLQVFISFIVTLFVSDRTWKWFVFWLLLHGKLMRVWSGLRDLIDFYGISQIVPEFIWNSREQNIFLSKSLILVFFYLSFDSSVLKYVL